MAFIKTQASEALASIRGWCLFKTRRLSEHWPQTPGV